MILSMTGYGTGCSRTDETHVSVEIRTVNHRFLDLHVRVPREYAYLETEVQQAVRNMIRRGRVDVNVTIQATGPIPVSISAETARAYMEAARRFSEDVGINDALDLKTLLTLPGVLQSKDATVPLDETKRANLSRLVRDGVCEALQSVVRMRQKEGATLESEIVSRLAKLGENARRIQDLGPATVLEYRQKLEERLCQLLPQHGLDPQRIAQEVALLVDKSDISEEITRLESHLDQYANLIESGKEAGKKMDFLLQEMQREINTILSKTGNQEVSRLGIAIKADIEKLREQVQNIE